MNVGVVVRRSLCQGCRHMHDSRDMVHSYGDKLYCSPGCATKAQWLISPIPLQRGPRD